MIKAIATITGAIAIAAASLAGAPAAGASVVKCPTGSYAIVVKAGPHGPTWGCTKSVWEQGHHRRHHHP